MQLQLIMDTIRSDVYNLSLSKLRERTTDSEQPIIVISKVFLSDFSYVTINKLYDNRVAQTPASSLEPNGKHEASLPNVTC